MKHFFHHVHPVCWYDFIFFMYFLFSTINANYIELNLTEIALSPSVTCKTVLYLSVFSLSLITEGLQSYDLADSRK